MLNSRLRLALPGSKDVEKEVISRTFKSFRFEPHPRRKILIIRGEIQISVSGGLYAEIIDETTEEFRKLIKLDGLSPETNLRAVGEEILDQCPFIPDDLLPALTSVLEILKNRKYDRHGVAILTSMDNGDPLRPGPMTFPEYFEDEDGMGGGDTEGDLKEVKMDSLDLYVELLYEELQDKVKGARSLWRLTSCSENLVTVFNHDTALNAVFRTLREDYRKSIDLTTHLLNCILSFTKFQDFHPLLISNKVTSVTLDIVEFELTRYEKWIEEVYRRKELTEDPEAPTTTKQRTDFEKVRIKFAELTRKQDQLLAAAFDVVRHISESSAFARELHGRGIVRLLMMTLERTNVKLLTVVISFLASLSSIGQAIGEMVEMKVIEESVRLLDQGIQRDLLQVMLPFYFNLSFNTKLRFKMVRLGVLAKLATIMDDADFEGHCILIMYNVSTDFRLRPKFITAEIIPKLVGKVMAASSNEYLLETKALLLNLASSKRCATVISGNGQLLRLVKAALQRQDHILLKVIRKVSSHRGGGAPRSLFAEVIPNIVGAVREKGPPEFIIECLGTLSNLALPDIDFCELLQGSQLLKVIRSVLNRPPPRIRVHGGDERSIHESLLLEVIIFLGTCGSEPSCADFLIQEGILDLLLDLGRMPALDTDVRVQLLYAIYRMSIHTKSRNYMLEQTKIPELIHSFIRSECAELREVAQAVWTVFGEYSEEWRDKVRAERFLAHNGHWIDICGRSGQVAMDRATLNSIHARINAEKDIGPVRKRASAKSSDSFEDSDEDDQESEDEEDQSEGDGEELGIRGPTSAQSEDLDGSESDQSRSRDIFDQFKHQFNQEMVNRIYGSANSETDDGRSRDSRTSSRMLKRSESTSRSKSRPTTAHHSGRSGGAGTSRQTGIKTPPLRGSFEGQSSIQSEAHPGKGMKPPIIVTIKPKESW